MYAAATLARTAKYTNNTEYMDYAKMAMAYCCSKQNSDGSWFYGEERKFHWIDNFHTGYNLDALKSYINYSDDTDYEKNLRHGFYFFTGPYTL